jgi:hypothetical protein
MLNSIGMPAWKLWCHRYHPMIRASMQYRHRHEFVPNLGLGVASMVGDFWMARWDKSVKKSPDPPP